MNIQNLNSEELEQLQALLNKMNPPQPTEKVYFDPLNKMIAEIMEEFDFDKVQMAMEYLGWKWAGEHVTVGMLKETAKRLLSDAAKVRLGDYKDDHWEQGIMSATGGLQATAYCDESKSKIDMLDLKFVLAEWDSQLKD
jgi:hypothetical protein